MDIRTTHLVALGTKLSADVPAEELGAIGQNSEGYGFFDVAWEFQFSGKKREGPFLPAIQAEAGIGGRMWRGDNGNASGSAGFIGLKAGVYVPNDGGANPFSPAILAGPVFQSGPDGSDLFLEASMQVPFGVSLFSAGVGIVPSLNVGISPFTGEVAAGLTLNLGIQTQ